MLPGAAILSGLGLIALGTAPSWPLFLAAGVPAGLGTGAIDGGVNGLYLDLFQTGRGRALNLLHVCFSVGAMSAPFVAGQLVEIGVPWGAILVSAGVAVLVIAVLFWIVPMPPGRHRAASDPAPSDLDATAIPTALDRRLLTAPLLLLGLAIGCYVASEVGVSNWLVRFLDTAALTVATSALTLYWAGLTVGRLVSARIADRFDHLLFAATAAFAVAVCLVGAILAPTLPLSIALFVLVGVASGPVFPMVIAAGGDRYPGRTAAVGGSLAFAAVVGSVVYPPAMGFMSVTVGLGVAMARRRAPRGRLRGVAPRGPPAARSSG